MKTDVLFKVAGIAILVYLCIVLKEISITMRLNGRYQSHGENQILNTRTGETYFWTQNEGWNVLLPNGSWKTIKTIPQ